MDILTGVDYDEATAHMAQHAPGARLLESITAELGGDYHTVWLDGPTVWWAWTEPGQDVWRLEKHTATEILPVLRSQLVLVTDRLADPARYEYEPDGRLDTDEETLAELYDVETAALAGGVPDLTPADVDRMIQARIAEARAEVARLAGLRVHHLRRVFGEGRGWQASAARALGVSPSAITQMVAADERRALERRDAARQARNRDET